MQVIMEKVSKSLYRMLVFIFISSGVMFAVLDTGDYSDHLEFHDTFYFVFVVSNPPPPPPRI